MPRDGRKIAIGAGIAAAVGGLIYALTRKRPPAPPPEGVVEAATVQIEVIGARGYSPVTLEEGGSYTVRLTITNATIKAVMPEVPWEATFNITIFAGTEWTTLIPTQSRDEYFGPAETRTFDYPMSVPLGTAGESGQIIATVRDPVGNEIASAIEPVTIAEVPIVYGATISIGV